MTIITENNLSLNIIILDQVTEMQNKEKGIYHMTQQIKKKVLDLNESSKYIASTILLENKMQQKMKALLIYSQAGLYKYGDMMSRKDDKRERKLKST